MNKIILSGNLGKDCELTFAAGTGKAIAKFSIGVAKGFGKDKGTNWFNCVMFGDRAEKLSPYLVKGTKVIVEGSVELGSYDAKDGTKKYTTDVFVNNVEMIGNKNNGQATENTNSNVDDMQIVDDDWPFN